MMKAESIAAERKRMVEVFREAKVQFAFLFGSTIDGERSSSAHDIDIAVHFDRYRFEAYLNLVERLSKVLKIKGDDLDLVVLNRANPRLKMEALLKGAPLFVRDWQVLNEFATDTFFEY